MLSQQDYQPANILEIIGGNPDIFINSHLKFLLGYKAFDVHPLKNLIAYETGCSLILWDM